MPIDPLGKDDFNRYVDRHDHQHSELDGRLTRDMVPMGVYLSDQRANERRLTELERDIGNKVGQTAHDALKTRMTAVEGRPASVRNYLLALAGLGLTLLGIVVSAYISSKGGT
jgi:hypothetical protein